MSGDGHANETRELNLDAIEAMRLVACDDGPDITWHQRQEAIWGLLDDGGHLPALVAEVRTLRAALDGRGVVLRDAYNDATRTRDAHIRRALAAEAEVRRLSALVPQPPPPGVVIVSWSGKRHIAQPGSKVQRDGSKRALCSEYTWGVEPDEDGDVVYGVKQGKRAELLPMCKSCTRSAAA